MLDPPLDDEGTRSRGGLLALAAVLVSALVGVLVVVAVHGGGSGAEATGPSSTLPGPTRVPSSTSTAPSSTAPPSTAACAYPAGGEHDGTATPPVDRDPARTGTAALTLSTSAGPLPITLARASAPCSVASLLSLAAQGFYDGTTCHRLTTGGVYLLQCGDPTGTGRGGPGYTVPDEPPTSGPASTGVYPRGTVALANADTPGTGGSQFFLVYRDSPLPPGYAVLGQLGGAGLRTLDAAAAAETTNHRTDGAPATTVRITATSAG